MKGISFCIQRPPSVSSAAALLMPVPEWDPTNTSGSPSRVHKWATWAFKPLSSPNAFLLNLLVFVFIHSANTYSWCLSLLQHTGRQGEHNGQKVLPDARMWIYTIRSLAVKGRGYAGGRSWGDCIGERGDDLGCWVSCGDWRTWETWPGNYTHGECCTGWKGGRRAIAHSSSALSWLLPVMTERQRGRESGPLSGARELRGSLLLLLCSDRVFVNSPVDSYPDLWPLDILK